MPSRTGTCNGIASFFFFLFFSFFPLTFFLILNLILSSRFSSFSSFVKLRLASTVEGEMVFLNKKREFAGSVYRLSFCFFLFLLLKVPPPPPPKKKIEKETGTPAPGGKNTTAQPQHLVSMRLYRGTTSNYFLGFENHLVNSQLQNRYVRVLPESYPENRTEISRFGIMNMTGMAHKSAHHAASASEEASRLFPAHLLNNGQVAFFIADPPVAWLQSI